MMSLPPELQSGGEMSSEDRYITAIATQKMKKSRFQYLYRNITIRKRSPFLDTLYIPRGSNYRLSGNYQGFGELGERAIYFQGAGEH